MLPVISGGNLSSRQGHMYFIRSDMGNTNKTLLCKRILENGEQLRMAPFAEDLRMRYFNLLQRYLESYNIFPGVEAGRFPSQQRYIVFL